MRQVLVICGAGASSTFLVHWMRKVAAARRLDLSLVAGSQDDLASRLDGLDIVLVGNHLHATFPQLLAQAAAAQVRAVLLPPIDFTATGAGIALDLVEQSVSAGGSVSEPSGSPDPGSFHG